MFAHQNESAGRGADAAAEQVRTNDPRIALLAWTGLSLLVVLCVGIVAGRTALQWAIAAWTVATLLAIRENCKRPATRDDDLAEERWLQAIVDTWSAGRSI